MMVAAPHVDLLLSGHDLRSLEEFAARAARAAARRAARCGGAWRSRPRATGADPRGDRRAGRRRRRQRRDRLRHRHDPLRRAARRRGATPGRGDRARRGASSPRPPRGRPAGVAGQPAPRPSARTRTTTWTTTRMIRLGSLAGYPFEGPRVLGGWTPPASAGGLRDRVQARPGDQARAVRRDLRRPLRRPVRRAIPVPPPAGGVLGRSGPAAGGRSTSAPTRCPAACRSHREQIAQELGAIYHPSCNEQQYDRSWKDEWIGEYTAPTTGPLTTGRDPDEPPRRDQRLPGAGATVLRLAGLPARGPDRRRCVADAVVQPGAPACRTPARAGGRLGRSARAAG